MSDTGDSEQSRQRYQEARKRLAEAKEKLESAGRELPSDDSEIRQRVQRLRSDVDEFDRQLQPKAGVSTDGCLLMVVALIAVVALLARTSYASANATYVAGS